MKKNLSSIILLIVLLGVFLGGCTSAGVASSWPGLSVADGVAYVTYGAEVYAVDIKNGNLVWRYPSEPDKAITYFASPAIADDVVIVGNYGNGLEAINTKNGVKKWSFDQAGDRYIGGALIYGGKIYAPNTDSYLYVLDEDGSLLWRFRTQKANWTTPVTNGDLLFLSSMDHSLYALDLDYPETGLALDEGGTRTLVSEPVWNADLGAAIFAEPSVGDDGKLFVGTLGGEFYAVNATNGKILWSFDADGELGSVWGPAVIQEDIVLFGDEKGKIYALSAENGNEIWPTAYTVDSSIIGGGAVLPEGIVFPTIGGKLIVINKEGQTLPVISLEGSIYSKPIFVDGKQIIAMIYSDHLLIALDENGREYWRFKPEE
ncbi:MAG TPA: PQQ-like beta-propeller repeat protein [Anaerolineae bacterium]|nr:PQQ-like beta-propeller repeat protein [Anaerolineae bacterium]